ncbi:unnamed protein product [Tenebrio molitor]|nr:unnamed protein product [Tenebrio molitor]
MQSGRWNLGGGLIAFCLKNEAPAEIGSYLDLNTLHQTLETF